MTDTTKIQLESAPSRVDNIVASIKKFATVSELLRMSGATIILASMSLFLMQGFEVTNDIQRYLMLLAQTLLLTAGGFGLSYLLNENKGARVFFGLSLSSIPANFAVLGAMLYSLVQWDSSLGNYPSYAHWVASDPSTTLAVVGVASLLLFGIARFGFSVLARKSSSWLTLALMVNCITLLLPVRGNIWAGGFALASILFAMWVVRSYGRDDETRSTVEGRFARVMLFVPALIMLARSLFLYELDALVILTFSTAAFLVLRQVAVQLDDESTFRNLLELASLPLPFIAAGSLCVAVDNYVADVVFGALFTITATAALWDLFERSGSLFMKRLTSVTAACTLSAGLVLWFWYADSTLAMIASTVILGVATAWTIYRQRSVATQIHAIGTTISAGFLIMSVVHGIDFGSWITLAVVGAAAVIGGSLIDRHGVTMKHHIGRMLKNKSEQRAP